MRKILFASLIALTAAACADNSSTPGDDGTGGGGGGGGTGSGSGSGSGSGGGVSTADAQRDYNDVAVSLGSNLAVGDLGTIIDSVNMAYGRFPAGFTTSDGPDYVLVQGQRAGLDIQYKVYCRDDADLLTACSGTENHAHVRPTYSGSLSGANASMDNVQRSGAWIVRDLTLPNARIGGAGADEFASHIGDGDYHLVVSDNLNHLLFDPANIAMPVGGSIDITVNVQRTRASASPAQRTFDVAAKIAFVGGDLATITLDGAQTYQLTLSSGAVIKQ